MKALRFYFETLNRAIILIGGGIISVALLVFSDPLRAALAFGGFTIIATIHAVLEEDTVRRKERANNQIFTRLNQFFDRSFRRNYLVERQIYTHYIGLFAWQDRFKREYEIIAFTEDEQKIYARANNLPENRISPVYISDMDFGASGIGVHGKNFDDLQLHGQDDLRQPLDIIPARTQSPNRICAHILFRTQIEPGHRRAYWISGIWKGTWNPLRKEGKDSGTLDLILRSELARYLLIRIVFPPGINPNDAELEPIGPVQAVSQFPPRKGTDENGRTVLEWEITSPQRVKYEYDVSCPGFCSLLKRIRLWVTHR